MKRLYPLAICYFLSIWGVSCKNGTSQMHEHHEFMKKAIADAAEQYFFTPDNIYASTERIKYYDSLLQLNPARPLYNFYNFQKAEALLYGGKPREAASIFRELIQTGKTYRSVEGLSNYQEGELESLLALSYLRLGEQENCIEGHNHASCIFPISPGAVHHKTEGSEKAVAALTGLLRDNSRDLHSRWLLNIAHMTLGQYPEGVPQRFRLPVTSLESEYPLKPFPDKSHYAGLALNSRAGGGVVDDFNNDGYLDVMVSSWFAKDQIRFFLNQKDGTFADDTHRANLTGITGGLNLVQADYNNDGHLDVFVLRGAWLEELGKHPNSLLRNNGDGTFTDVTKTAGLLSFHPTQTAVWRDFNNDGWLDLFIGNESSDQHNIHPCELYINLGDGTFLEVAKEAGVEVNTGDMHFYYIKGVNASDIDNDGLQDIYVSTLDQRTQNFLFKNMGNDTSGIPHFADMTKKAGLLEDISSFPLWFWDYNHDGFQDIFVAGYKRSVPWGRITSDVMAEYLNQDHQAEVARLYQNQGDGTFVNVAALHHVNRISYAMGANFGDLDNDGYLDFYLSTGEVDFASIIPNRMFRNHMGKTFQDVTTAGGFGHLQKGHAVSFADIDNDGDQDVHVVMGGAFEGDVFYNSLFENPYQNENNWINIRLVGTVSNRSALGSRVKVTISEGVEERFIYREVTSGGSFGCNPLRLEIGLAGAKVVKELRIDWAGSGMHQIFTDLPVNKFVTIEEGEPAFIVQ